mmetsp:Transcript_47416/g.88307  ORF Transcript_47416/g.88307 Transcript_47416/m.88307 type:complete len:429 (-) Transcript_47416:36-1322(-)
MRSLAFRPLQLQPVLSEAHIRTGAPVGSVPPCLPGRPPRAGLPASVRLPPLSASAGNAYGDVATDFRSPPDVISGAGFGERGADFALAEASAAVAEAPAEAPGFFSASSCPPSRPPSLPPPLPPGTDAAAAERRASPSTPLQADADRGAGLEVHLLPADEDLCGERAALQSEVDALLQHVQVLGRRLADAEQERDAKSAEARQMQEAFDKETTRAEAAQADVLAARRRFESLQMVLRQAASLDSGRSGVGHALRDERLLPDAADDFLGPAQHLAIAEAENRALLAELAKARDHADSNAEMAACKRVLAEQQPLVEKLRGKLTEQYVENEMLRSQIAQIQAARSGQAPANDRWAVSRWQGSDAAVGLFSKVEQADVCRSGRSSPVSAEDVEALSEAGSELSSRAADAVSDSDYMPGSPPGCDVAVRIVI